MKNALITVAALAAISLAQGPAVQQRGPAHWNPEDFAKLMEFAQHLEIEEVHTGAGIPPYTVTTFRLVGANLQIVNGEGYTATTNGAGNVILGYNEPWQTSWPTPQAEGRTGSHSLIIGAGHQYLGAATLISGHENVVTGYAAAAIGGGYNTVEGTRAAAVGGQRARLDATGCVTTGGIDSTVGGSAWWSTISGGKERSVSTKHSWRAGDLFESD